MPIENKTQIKANICNYAITSTGKSSERLRERHRELKDKTPETALLNPVKRRTLHAAARI